MIFNSRNEKFKTPRGAVATDQEFTVRFPLPKWVEVNEVLFCVRKSEQNFYPMTFSHEEEGDNVYTVTLKLSKEGIYHYSFRVFNEFGMWQYGRDEYMNAVCGENLPEWQLTVYKSSYKTPDFVKGGIIYHIFVDRFNRADGVVADGRYRLHGSWDEDPEIVGPDGKYRADDFFGGNLKGITEKLDYLKSLGVTVLYLSPIFESSSNHRYDTGDYLKIDPLLGTEEDLTELIGKAGDLDIAVVLDGVFNHTGSDSVYFNKFGRYDSVGACQSKTSPYYKWYTFQHYPDKYTSWWGVDCCPTVVHTNPTYKRFIMGAGGVIEKWTKLGVKGWRLDVVDELPIEFVNELRKSIKAINPDCFILGEVWEDASNKVSYDILRPYLLGDQLDGVMNYPFRTAVLDYVKYGDVSAFKSAVWTVLENYPRRTVDCLMNMLDTHDTVRAINWLSDVSIDGTTKAERLKTKLTGKAYDDAKLRLCMAVALNYMLPGVPSVFYGDEAGVQGYEDPLNRRTYPWGHEDEKLVGFYRKIGGIRTNNRDIFSGNFEILDDYKVLAMEWTKGDKRLTFVCNNGKNWEPFKVVSDSINLLNNRAVLKGNYTLAPFEFMIVKNFNGDVDNI